MVIKYSLTRRVLAGVLALTFIVGIIFYLLFDAGFYGSAIIVLIPLIGVVLNFIVILLNQGAMPVVVRNEEWRGFIMASPDHAFLGPETRLRFLADRFSPPTKVMKLWNLIAGRPPAVSKMMSVGDILVTSGLIALPCAVLIERIMRV